MGRLLKSMAWLLAGAALSIAVLAGESAGRALAPWALGSFLMLAAALAAAGTCLEGGAAPPRRGFLVPAFLLLSALGWAAWRAPEPWTGRMVLLEWGLGTGLAAGLALWASASRARGLGPLLLGAAASLAVFAAYQRLLGLGILREAFDLDPGLAGPSAALTSRGRILAASRISSGEPFGNFALSNTLAALFLLLFPLAMGLAWDRWKEGRRAQAGILALLGMGLMALLPVTGSKGALLVLGLTLLGWSLRRAWASRRSRRALGATALGILALLAWRLLAAGPLHHSTAFRLGYWAGAGRAVFEHPWAGLGLGGFEAEYNRLRPVWGRDVTKVHCDPLQLWAEAGIWALVAAVWLGGLCWSRGREVPPAEAESPEDGPRWTWCLAGGLPLLLAWQVPATLSPIFFHGEAGRWAVGAAMAAAGGLAAWASCGRWGVGARSGALAGTLLMALHGLGDIDLTSPGAAWPFWGLLGILAAQAPQEKSRKAGWGSLALLVGLLAFLVPFLTRWAPRALAAERAVHETRDLLTRTRPLSSALHEELKAAAGLGSREALALEGDVQERAWRGGAPDEAFQASVLARRRAAALGGGDWVTRLALSRIFQLSAPERPERALEAVTWADAAVEACPTAPRLRLEAARTRLTALAHPAMLAAVAKAWGLEPRAAADRLMEQAFQALKTALVLDPQVLDEGKRLEPDEKAWAQARLAGGR